jgi:diguanylate cyclase (GGDEF)-like protein
MQKIALLYDASQAVLSTFELDEVLHQILIIVRDFFHLQKVAILLLDKQNQQLTLRTQTGWPEHNVQVPVGKGLVGTAAQQKRPIYSRDVSQDQRYIASMADTRSELAIPLMVRNEVIGVLDCQSPDQDYFDSETIDLLTLFSTQASLAVQNARLHSLERRRAQQLEAINTIAQQMTVVVELRELLAKVCWLVEKAFQLDHVSVLLKDEQDLVLRAHEGKLTLRIPEDARLPAGAGLWGRALVSGKSVIVNDIRQDTDYIGFLEETRSQMCIPLLSFGQTLGVLVLDTTRVEGFHFSDQPTLESVADICANAIQNANHVDRVRQLAYIDGLTGIFNRRFFEMRINEEIERARRFANGMSVIMVDIDQFKRLNDEFGHLLGDEVLRQISSVFSQHIRKIDVVCRYGGEEFAILLPETHVEQALGVADKLRRIVETWQFPGVPRPVTISAGLAAFPRHGITRDELVKAADAGLYAAKQAGRNRIFLAPNGEKRAAAAQS